MPKDLVIKTAFLIALNHIMIIATCSYVVLNFDWITKAMAFIFGLMTIPIIIAVSIFQVWKMFEIQLVEVSEMSSVEKEENH